MQNRVWLLAAALIASAAPAAANYYTFDATFTFSDSSPRFLPYGVDAPGSGVGVSSRSPVNEVRSFAGVQGFRGRMWRWFVNPLASPGFAHAQVVDMFGIGNPDFRQTSSGGLLGKGLHGRMGIPGFAFEYYEANGTQVWGLPLTVDESEGLGLGGTVPMTSGSGSVRFGTWTTGTVIEPNVIIASEETFGPMRVHGVLTGMGSDARTPGGLGTVSLVTPIRVVSGPLGPRAAIGKLTLHFTPEPGRAMLLLGGCGALALLGRQRRRVD